MDESLSMAWVCEAGGRPFALAAHETIGYVRDARVYPVPLTPAYCRNVIPWGNKLVPVLDPMILLGRDLAAAPNELVLVAWQERAYAPLEHIALAVDTTPRRVMVSDAQACELPEDMPELLQEVSLACFKERDRATPVLNIHELCSPEFRERMRGR